MLSIWVLACGTGRIQIYSIKEIYEFKKNSLIYYKKRTALVYAEFETLSKLANYAMFVPTDANVFCTKRVIFYPIKQWPKNILYVSFQLINYQKALRVTLLVLCVMRISLPNHEAVGWPSTYHRLMKWNSSIPMETSPPFFENLYGTKILIFHESCLIDSYWRCTWLPTGHYCVFNIAKI